MTAYLSIIRMRFILLLQYRMAAAAAIATQFLFGLVRVMIFDGFYAADPLGQPMSLAMTVSYVWLGQAFLGMLPWNGDADVQAMIRKGDVAYELCRPLDLFNHWFARAVALRSAPTMLRAVPLLVVAGLLMPETYRLQPPASAAAGGYWLLAMVAALLLAAAITNLINISMLWTISGDGVMRLAPAVVLLGSGMIVPLPLLPPWAERLFQVLPFAGLVDTPLRFYTGILGGGDLLPQLALQLGWAAALIAGGRWLLARGLERAVVQGG